MLQEDSKDGPKILQMNLLGRERVREYALSELTVTQPQTLTHIHKKGCVYFRSKSPGSGVDIVCV